MLGKVLSVNIAREATLPMRGQQARTGIFKDPVSGPVHAGRLGLEGDFQADKRVHGGPDKAIYLYPSEHYPAWEAELGVDGLSYGAFGENLTISGLLESEVHIGDRFRIGTALLEVTKPRLPCWKLATKFGRPDMVKRMHANELSGFYVRVIEEGSISASDEIERVSKNETRQTIPEIFRLKKDQ